MGRTCMKKKRNFNLDGSMWDSARKETFGATTIKMGGPSQEVYTNAGSKCQIPCLSDG